MHDEVPSDYSSEFVRNALVAQVVDYAIITLDTYGVVTSWNAGAARLKGYSETEAIGQHFSAFYPQEDRAAGLPLDLLERARDEGRVEHVGWRIRKDGTRFWADVVITALRDGAGYLMGYGKVTRDLTEQHRLQEQLRASEMRLRVLVSQVVDYAIIGLDPYGVITTWNAGAERLKGYRADEAIGHHFSMFYTRTDRHDGLPLDLLQDARTHGRVGHTGWRVRKDGTRFWGDVVITALHDQAGVLTGYAKVTRDRTEQHRLEQVQASLFATISHDLRTPITTIGAYASLIVDAEADERAEFAERILFNAERLDELVGGLFDYAKLRAGGEKAHLQPVSVHDIVSQTIADHERMLRGREIQIEDAGLQVLADPGALRRVLDNLISNAARYSGDGTPLKITCSAVRDRVHLDVIDHGRGIDPEDLPMIFSEFYRGKLAENDGGTGLGLASVQQLVVLQGGRVWIDSKLDVGTTVTVELARVEPDEPAPT
ncbi:MAG: PAS domain-containing sensor histidine kinase [Jatrophihabitans sp.]